MSKGNESKCPVMHGALTTNSASGSERGEHWDIRIEGKDRSHEIEKGNGF